MPSDSTGRPVVSKPQGPLQPHSHTGTVTVGGPRGSVRDVTRDAYDGTLETGSANAVVVGSVRDRNDETTHEIRMIR